MWTKIIGSSVLLNEVYSITRKSILFIIKRKARAFWITHKTRCFTVRGTRISQKELTRKTCTWMTSNCSTWNSKVRQCLLSRQIEYFGVPESAVKPLYVICPPVSFLFYWVSGHWYERIITSDSSFREVRFSQRQPFGILGSDRQHSPNDRFWFKNQRK